MTRLIKTVLYGVVFSVWILICGEVFLRVISSITPIYNIEMLKYAKELKVESNNPKISHVHRPNSSARLMSVDITLNSLGHRNEELEYQKKKDKKRIYMLGSSIMLGWGVSEEDGFAKVFQRKLNKKNKKRGSPNYLTINAGIGNYNTFYQVELFEEQVSIVDPDIVVLQYYINDAEANPRGTDNIILKYSLLAASAHYYFHSILFVSSSSIEEYYSNMYEDENNGWKQAQASIAKLKTICAERHIPVIALLIPDFHDLSSDGVFFKIYQKIQTTFDKNEIPMVNTFSAIQNKFKENPREAWLANDDPHPNLAVHQIIGNELYEFFVKQNLY